MIVISCIRVKKLLSEKGIDDARLIPKQYFSHSKGHYSKLEDIMHQSHIHVKEGDAFPYDLAAYLEVSVDYLLGWDNDKSFHVISVGNDPYFKLTQISNLIGKYAKQEELSLFNTNQLAERTGIDRDVFDYIFNNAKGSSWWITTSYYITTRLAKAFNFDWYTVMSYLLQAEDPDGTGKEILRKLVDKYNKEFDEDIIVAE